MSLTEDFVREIENKILTGDWPIGQRVPPLRELAERFGVSRSVVNAGIVELQNKGYILTVPRKCSVVADWKKQGTFAVLKGLVENELFDKSFTDNILEARMTIECAAVRDAALRRTAADLQDINDVIAAETRAVTIDERADSDIAFHHTVTVASHNIVYPMLLKSFEDMVKKFVTYFYQNTFDRTKILSQHNIIYKAITDGNVDVAEDTMRELLKQGEGVVGELFKV